MIPLFHCDVPLCCITSAATEFNVPAKIIIAVLNVERGKNNEISKNKNKTYDIGPMQVNSAWLPELKRFSISEEDLLHDPCLNVRVGTWILAKAIAEEKSLLKGIGNYNSHTPWRNDQYAENVRINFTKLSLILDKD